MKTNVIIYFINVFVFQVVIAMSSQDLVINENNPTYSVGHVS